MTGTHTSKGDGRGGRDRPAPVVEPVVADEARPSPFESALPTAFSERLPFQPHKSAVQRATVTDHGPRLSTEEVERYRSGLGTTVYGELLTERVAAVLNTQLSHHTVEAVRESVWRFAGPTPIVEQVYELVTQYGSIEQLRRLAEVIDSRCAAADGPAFYSPGDTSLGTAVRYLGVNKSILPVDWKLRTSAEISTGAVVVLDEVVLAKIRSDDRFREALVNSKAVLLAPLGYLNGITPFRTPLLSEVEDRVDTVLRQGEISPHHTPAEVSQRIRQVFEEEVTTQLNRVEPRLCAQVEFVDARQALGETAIERIAMQLNGCAGISPEKLESQLGHFPPDYRATIKDLLVQCAHVHSHISLGRAAREHGQMIERLAQERGLDLESVAFHCPERNKSFSMYGLIFRQANPSFPISSFTSATNLRSWRAAQGDAPHMVVVLDDIAGSGDSLYRIIEPTAALGVKPQDIVLSPLICSEIALRMLRERPESRCCTIAPMTVEERIIDRSLYRDGSTELQLKIRAALGDLGFGQSGKMVALPYMSPDNNVELFARCFAEFFTLYEGAVRGWDQGIKKFAKNRMDAPFSVVYGEAQAKLEDGRFIAGNLPTLRGLIEHEGQLRIFWRDLPESIKESLSESWRETETALIAERAVVIYGQLNLFRDVFYTAGASERDHVSVVNDFELLKKIAAGLELSPELRDAIVECGTIIDQEMKTRYGRSS